MWGRLEGAVKNYGGARDHLREAVEGFVAKGGEGKKSHVVALQVWVRLERRQGNKWAVRGLLEQANNGIDKRYGERGEGEGGEKGEGGRRPEATVGMLHAWALAEQQCDNVAKARSLLDRAFQLAPDNAYIIQVYRYQPPIHL
jgi:hypothetical protein